MRVRGWLFCLVCVLVGCTPFNIRYLDAGPCDADTCTQDAGD